MMRHLPNMLTLGNLVSGCIAIVLILNSEPYQQSLPNSVDTYYVFGVEQAYWGALMIGLAAIFDVFDGLVARALKVSSDLGADLDSLADVVSFGVAPSMILFKAIWSAYMNEPGALTVPMIATLPAFAVACCSALRLARFNVSPPSATGSFTGMPTPAAGIFIASLPLINFYNPMHLGEYLQKPWLLYALCALVSWLMVSKIPFFKLVPYRWNLGSVWRQLVLVAVAIPAIIFLQVAALPAVFLIYCLLSIFTKEEQAVRSREQVILRED